MTLRCFLHGPTSLIWTSILSLRLGLGLGFLRFLGLILLRLVGANRRVVFVAATHLGVPRISTGWDGLIRHHAPASSSEDGQPQVAKYAEREMGFEPTTTTLATWCSTPELLPRRHPSLTAASSPGSTGASTMVSVYAPDPECKTPSAAKRPPRNEPGKAMPALEYDRAAGQHRTSTRATRPLGSCLSFA